MVHGVHPELENLRGAILQAALEARTRPETADELRLSDLFQEQPVRRARSRVLNEDLLFVADAAEIPPDNTLIVYRESELRQMVGKPLEQVRAIHQVKQELDGEIAGDRGKQERTVT